MPASTLRIMMPNLDTNGHGPSVNRGRHSSSDPSTTAQFSEIAARLTSGAENQTRALDAAQIRATEFARTLAETTVQVESLSASSEETASGLNEIAASVEQITASAAQVATAATQTATAIQQISQGSQAVT